MAYQLRLYLRAISFIDLLISGLSILLYLVAIWYFAHAIYMRGVAMVFGIVGALILIVFKSIGLWTCWNLISIINRYFKDDNLTDLEQLEFNIAWKWLKTKVALLIVPVVTLGFIMMVFGECWVCMGVGIGWIGVEVILIVLGRVYMLRN